MGVSWPRSGHHLLADLLRAYFGDIFRYCSFYDPDEDCCRQAPCVRSEVSFSKNHDFGLKLPILSGRRYLVQFRQFAPSVISDYQLFLFVNKYDDSEKNFRAFAWHKLEEYNKFMEKWGSPRDTDVSILYISYENLTNDPYRALQRAISFFTEDAIDGDVMQEIIKNIRKTELNDGIFKITENFGVKETRKVEDFKHYDPILFDELVDRSRLNYDLLANGGVTLNHRICSSPPA